MGDSLGRLIKFECAYCEKNFTLSKRLVEQVEEVAIIKCPYCNSVEDVSEVIEK